MGRRSYEYDWNNMTKADWEDLKVISDRLGVLNEAYGFPMITTEPEFKACKAVYKDICAHKKDWFEEVFHLHEADKVPSHCERAVVVLTYLSVHYNQREKFDKAYATQDITMAVLELLRKQYFENDRFQIGQDQKNRFLFRKYSFYAARYNTVTLMDDNPRAREDTIHAFRESASLELDHFPNVIPKQDMILLVRSPYGGGGKANIHTSKQLRKNVSDDLIWRLASQAAKFRKTIFQNDAAKRALIEWHCPICAASGDHLLVCAGCKKVAFCGREHQLEYWQRHKKDCKEEQARAAAAAAGEEQEKKTAKKNKGKNKK